MPPIAAKLAPEAPRLAQVALAAAAVVAEPWALGVLGLALYSWLEQEVPAVFKAAAPLVVALLAGGALAEAAQAAWGGAGGAGRAGGALAHLLPVRQPLALGTFLVYSLLAYGRRGLPAAGLVALGTVSRVHATPHWAAELAGGALAGGALAAMVYVATLRLFPRSHLARLRAGRRGRAGDAAARESPPSA